MEKEKEKQILILHLYNILTQMIVFGDFKRRHTKNDNIMKF